MKGNTLYHSLWSLFFPTGGRRRKALSGACIGLHLARLDQRQQRAGSPRMLDDLGKIMEGTRFSL
jgi:hypothetical protein